MGQLSILLWLALVSAIAWFAPVVDMGGQPSFNGQVFWFAVMIGLLATVAFVAIRAVWRRSTRG